MQKSVFEMVQSKNEFRNLTLTTIYIIVIDTLYIATFLTIIKRK